MKTSEEGSWIGKTTTRDQQDIEDYLIKQNTQHKTILHIGIGNSSLYSKLGSKNNIIGITIYLSEHQKSADLGYATILIDKYSQRFYDTFKTLSVDIVIDNNPSSYASSQTGFDTYITTIKAMLNSGGQYITHLSGMYYAINNGFSIKLEELQKKMGDDFTTTQINNVVIMTKQ